MKNNKRRQGVDHAPARSVTRASVARAEARAEQARRRVRTAKTRLKRARKQLKAAKRDAKRARKQAATAVRSSKQTRRKRATTRSRATTAQRALAKPEDRKKKSPTRPRKVLPQKKTARAKPKAVVAVKRSAGVIRRERNRTPEQLAPSRGRLKNRKRPSRKVAAPSKSARVSSRPRNAGATGAQIESPKTTVSNSDAQSAPPPSAAATSIEVNESQSPPST